MIDKGVGFTVLFPKDVLDAEERERLGHFPGAFEKRPQILTLDFVLAAHLLYQEFGIAEHAQSADAVGFCVVECGDQAEIFGDIVGVLADVFLQLCDNFPRWVTNDHAIGGGTGISSRTPIDVGLVGGRALLFRLRIGEETRAARRLRTPGHHEVAAPFSGCRGAACGMGSRV